MMDKLISLVAGAAPAVATALGGPLAGKAVSMIAGALGVEDNVDAVTKAIQADPNLAYKLRELDIKELEAHNANTDSARKMNASIQTSEHASSLAKNAAYIIDFAIVGATIFMTWFLFFKGVPEANKELAYMAFGSLLTLSGTVVNFHRGSSQGSKDKADEVKALKGR
jgi:hypothetical protein